MSITGPALLSATPSDNLDHVAVNSDIVLTFDQSVLAGSGSIVISDGHSQTYIDKDGDLLSRIVGASDTRALSLTDPEVSISGSTVTIHLDTALKAGTGYSVTMASGVLTDASANAYAGLSDTTQLNFTTITSRVAPTAVIGAAITFEDSGLSSSDYITNSAAQTLSGTYSG